MNFDQIWEKYEKGFGDFQGERHYSLLKTLSAITHLKLKINFQLPNSKLLGLHDDYNVYYFINYVSKRIPPPLHIPLCASLLKDACKSCQL